MHHRRLVPIAVVQYLSAENDVFFSIEHLDYHIIVS